MEGGSNFINLEYFFYKIYNLFFGGGSVNTGEIGTQINNTLSVVKSIFVFIVTIVSIIVIVFILYSLVRIVELRKQEHRKLQENLFVEPMEPKNDSKWHKVLELINSNNEADWRLGVMEADNMLDDMTKELGYVGDTLGERLKNSNSSQFKTINNAWEAHKIRNKIAHEGMNYKMLYRDAKTAIDLYESVFVEFKYL